MNCSKYFYIRKYFMSLNQQVFVLSKASPSAYSKSFNWNNQVFNLDDSREWKQNFVVSPVTQCKNLFVTAVLWKIIKQTAQVFPAERTFSNHLPSSQILWCPGIASIISRWTSSNYLPSCTPICPVRPTSEVFASGRY